MPKTHAIPTLSTPAGARVAWLVTFMTALSDESRTNAEAILRRTAADLQAQGESDTAELVQVMAGILHALDFTDPRNRGERR